MNKKTVKDIDVRGKRVGVILSGGNVDPAQAGEWFSAG